MTRPLPLAALAAAALLAACQTEANRGAAPTATAPQQMAAVGESDPGPGACGADISAYRRINLMRRMGTQKRFTLLGATIEQQTLYQGLFGRSRVWRILSYWVIFRVLTRRMFLRQPERLSTERLRIGQGVAIRVLPPSARSE